jgi:hypothetical protein
MNFIIEQIALYPPDPERAIEFLKAVGLTEWIQDIVVASGKVHGNLSHNEAELNFN